MYYKSAEFAKVFAIDAHTGLKKGYFFRCPYF